MKSKRRSLLTSTRRKPDDSKIKNFVVLHAHHIVMGAVLQFMLAAVVLGELLNVYDAVWWWDDMLHGLSGLLFGIIGLFVIYAINKRSDMRISASFVAMFVICFAMAVGVVWEIYEFMMDVTLRTTMQQWNMGQSAIVIGKEYQSMGLRDTMSDLITATIGAVVAGVFSYYAYGRKRRAVRLIMKHAFPTVK